MPTNEKEYNGNLFDQLEIVEEALALAHEENATKTIAYLEKKKEYINRKLYQKPPLISE
ncbi:MAG: hypothetical protein J6O71_03525 [Lachnospiraceae bacterium]|nr:hypothetical protein [Lachnospiraceae bacterium]